MIFIDIYDLRAQVAKALAHPTRLRLIDLLSRETEVCVCKLVEELGESQSTVSKHLAILKEAGIVTNRKEGLMVLYRLQTPCVKDFFRCLDGVLKHDLKTKQAQLGEDLE